MKTHHLRQTLAVVTATVLALLGTSLLLIASVGSLEADAIVFAVVSVVIVLAAAGFVLRSPSNAVTWVLYMAVAFLTTGFAALMVFEALAAADNNAARVAFLLSFTGWWPVIVMLGVAFPLLFPTGRILTSRWRWVAWLASLSIAALALQHAYAGLTMPLSEMASCDGCEGQGTILDSLASVGQAGIVVSVVGAVISLGVRWQRARGSERQQIKWLLFAFSILAIGVVLEITAESTLSLALLVVGLLFLPVSIVIAITRYHLYDIDRIVSRTVTYTVVIGLLALVFGAAVWAVTQILPATDNDLVIVAATLGAAALFHPLRIRIQRLVDRRFNRSRYDAQLVAEKFTARIRDEVDPEKISDGWIDVVTETMQPQAIGVWVKDPERVRSPR